MDTNERNQVRLILEHLASETLRSTQIAQKAMHAEHAAMGRLQSGSTVRSAVEIIEDHAAKYVEQAVDQTSAVAKDTDAFNLIAASSTALFRGFELQVKDAIKLAAPGGGQTFQSVADAGEKLFADVRSRIFKQLEIHRFSFTRPSRGDLAAKQIGIAPSGAISPPVGGKRNPGGKPLAGHWDAMWAAIAVKLWSGELQPKLQADVKKAMLDWFNEAEIEIGDTAVTQRARQLWQAMQDADS